MKIYLNLLKQIAVIAACALLATACADKESSLGINLVDNGMVYHGQQATLHATSAMSVRDDSLLTTNYIYGIIGNYHDATFGQVRASLYTQIALPTNDADINFTDMIIDSVILSLYKESIYPDTSHTYNFHFEVMQLNEVLLSDTAYYSTDVLPVNPSAVYFDQDMMVGPTDTILRLKLDNSIATILSQHATAEEFLQLTKGLRIRLTDAGDEGMLGIKLSSSESLLRVYYRSSPTDMIGSTYSFQLGIGASRFNHFEHDYTGSVAGGNDSVDGSQTIYLEPLGGYNILVNFTNDIRSFAAAHPTATIHHAEMLLPLAPTADAMRPEQLLAMQMDSNKASTYINDLLDPYTLGGFDGKYDAARNCYRIRVTQHVQNMLRRGEDSGTLVLLNNRRNAAPRTVIGGPSATDPIRIEIVYTED